MKVNSTVCSTIYLVVPIIVKVRLQRSLQLIFHIYYRGGGEALSHSLQIFLNRSCSYLFWNISYYIIYDPSLDSSIGGASAWYSRGPWFKSRKGDNFSIKINHWFIPILIQIYYSNMYSALWHMVDIAAHRGPTYKRVFNYCQTSVLFLYIGATLVDNRAHGHFTLVGSLTWGSVLNPLVAFISTTVYIYICYALFSNAVKE